MPRLMDIYVYMLRCRDSSYYVGLTRAGLDQRIGQHQEGVFDGYTASRRPVVLVWNEHFISIRDAIARERQLKGWRREKKEALIRGDYQFLPALARTAKPKSPSSS